MVGWHHRLDVHEFELVPVMKRKDWCWSGNSNTLATWCEELTHWKRPWCWERLKAGGEGDDRGWDGCIASLTQWTWVWTSSSWWWTGKSGVHGVTKSQTQLSYWTELPSCTLDIGMYVDSLPCTSDGVKGFLVTPSNNLKRQLAFLTLSYIVFNNNCIIVQSSIFIIYATIYYYI